MKMIPTDFNKLRRLLDEAMTYADQEEATRLAREGLNAAIREERMGEIMYFKAQRFIIDENYEEALTALDQAIKYNPKDGAAYNDRALCKMELGASEALVLGDFDRGIKVE